MKKQITIIIALILIMGNMFLVNAEISVSGFNSVITDSSFNQTRHTLYITLDDTSDDQIAKQVETNLTILATHNLNFTFSNNITLITCFYKSQQTKNFYDIDGNLANSTIEIKTFDYNYSATSLIDYQLKNKDILQVDLDCFYDSAVDNSIFQYQSESVIGLGINTPSYTCGKCSRGDFEETITAYIDLQKKVADETLVYTKSVMITDRITEFWLMLYWILRISFFIILVYLIFAIALRFYKFFKDLERNV